MIDSRFFTHNRDMIAKRLGGGALIVVTGYTDMQRSGDMAHAFEQESHFWYLTGIEAPDWQLIMSGKKAWLVAPEVDDVKQTFDGSLPAEKAMNRSGVTQVISKNDASALLRQLHRQHSVVYMPKPPKHIEEYTSFHPNPAPAKAERQMERIFERVVDCSRELATLRAIKQPVEIEALQKAIDITAEGFAALRIELAELKYEYQAEARMTFEIRRRGAAGHAYAPIVAAQKNACTLHYVANDQPFTKKHPLLMDIGAKYDGYSADITRTFMAGQPSKRQQAVYDAVLKAQEACIRLVRPGLSFVDYQEQVDEIMTQAIASLGFAENRLRDLFPHAVTHSLGIDVHDVFGDYKEFTPGMVFTIEPGIYIEDESIGIRIEDDLLVRETDVKVLSQKIPKAVMYTEEKK